MGDQRELKIVQRYDRPNGERATIPISISLERSAEPEVEEFGKARSSEPLIDSGSPQSEHDYYDNVSIRKAIVVSRYIRMLRDWVQDNDRKKSAGKNLTTTKARNGGIVSNEYQSRFEAFTAYFESECKLMNDDELARDLNVLKMLFDRKR